jgi:hypothetical protein
MGSFSTASGLKSTAMGYTTTASGDYSTAMGNNTIAKTFGETAIGLYNTDYTPQSTSSFNSEDRLFVIGNGTSSFSKSNALVMLKNGNTTFSGTVKMGAVTYPNTDGSANQVLATDGAGNASWVTPTASGFTHEVSDEFTATASQASFTLSNTPGANSKVKMYINGIRISNTAYSINGTTLSYNSTNNGNYTISVGDRIQFDFSY